ncbi:MAG: single-stranded-DNA-specific exonuclease RecJ [Clostridia bacterium]|nr:single-stranded-DNA-specific exonuclease RecJ [Clostridia bacterium]
MKINESKEKNWIIRSSGDSSVNEKVNSIARELGISPIVARLLYNRGYRDALSAKAFIYMESEMLVNPLLMKDMDLGAARIAEAVRNKEKITVYGDYDVDGVTAVCTLYLYLKSLSANVDYYIPNRNGEGYGVSVSAIDTIAEGGTTLIITVDTGITAIDEVKYAKEKGIDFIVTDHHECRDDIPECSAVINPHRPDCPYPFKELAGVGVVFKLICGYEELILGKTRLKAAEKIFSEYSDLVAIGTIADVMPIKDENRIIVRLGLNKIENTPRVGLAALIDAAQSRSDQLKSHQKRKKTKITSGFIGYTIAPRINAAGRIRSAEMAVELFLSEDRDEAMKIALQLCQANRERQAEENKIMKEAYSKIEECDIDKDPVIVLDADSWHHGVIGIVSSRITEKYFRPSILVSFEGNEGEPSPDDIGKGSGRSIKGLNLVDALYYCSDQLTKFGGHELAAGLSVTRERLPEFRQKINEYARNNLSEEDMVPSIEADYEIDFSDIDLALAKGFNMLEPYGVENPVPVLVLRGAVLVDISGVSEGKHTKLTVSDGKSTLTAMYFSNSPESLGLYIGDKIDLLFNLDINEWGERESVQLVVRDLKHSLSQEKLFEAERKRFEEIRGGARFYESEGILPARDDFAAVYKFMLGAQRAGQSSLSHRDITSRFNGDGSLPKIGYAKLKVIIMVFMELNLVSITETEEEVYSFNIHYTSSKTELDKSTLLRRLRQQLIRE